MRSVESGRADRWIALGIFKLSYQKIEGFAREQPQVFEKIVDKSNFEIDEKVKTKLQKFIKKIQVRHATPSWKTASAVRKPSISRG